MNSKSVLCLVLLVSLAVLIEAREPPKTLQIGVKHRPETCTRKSKAGDKLSMHYVGTLFSDGTEFDSSVGRNQPFEFVLGKGQVIKGWDQGLVGMCIGEKRKLTIPSHLAYGSRSMGKIPADSTLVFEVELLNILNPESA